ncbi:MAG: hypothetical protein GY760_03025 [Deltaproteobacteria bacterium]|nr:hypothetical protein [Deltaproteobacteria bacterium]
MSGINISQLVKNKEPTTSKKRRKKRLNLSDFSKEYSNHQAESSSKVVAQPVANYQQSDSKLVARTSSTEIAEKESSSKVVAQPVAEVVANYQQSDSKLVANSRFSELSGLQRNLLRTLYYSCRNNGKKITQPLSIQYLSESLETTSGTVKNGIHRLVSKGLIQKDRFKNGRGGWTQYKLEDHTYNELLQDESSSKVVANYQQSSSKVVAQPVAELVAKAPSSNSNILLNNTITTQPAKNYDWLQDIQTPDNLKSLGFGVGHLKQLKEKFSLTPEQIQNGLEAFSFDLAQGELERLKARGIQNIIGYFFGAMKSGGYNSVSDGFIPAEELAEKEMLERLEKKQKERKERKDKLEILLFEEWLETKNKNEILEIERPVSGYLDIIHKAGLKDYFLKNEFDKFKSEIQ